MTTTPLLNARVATEVVARIDALARSVGVTRSDLVRAAITELLADPSKAFARLGVIPGPEQIGGAE